MNKFLENNIENYGIYCGRYNIQKSSIDDCINDNECIWNEYTSRIGTVTGWCGQAPIPPSNS